LKARELPQAEPHDKRERQRRTGKQQRMTTNLNQHWKLFALEQLNRIEELYCRCISPLARRRIRTLSAQGMPPQLVGPLEFLFTGQLAPDDADRVRAIENLRAQLARQKQTYPPVSASSSPPADGAVMAHRVSIPRAWGTFLFLCAKSFRVKRILEMGSGAGISGAYLSAAPSCESLTTIEGSAARAALARETLKAVGAPARVLQMDLNAALDDIFGAKDANFDLMYLDGDHT
jgi:hypothetical protein